MLVIGTELDTAVRDAPQANAKPDPQEQADYYEALFQSIKEKNWINGIHWWAWYLIRDACSALSWLTHYLRLKFCGI